MRKLSEQYMSAMQGSGFLAPLIQEVIADKDLDLQIRDNYLNIYYKGNSLLKLTRRHNRYLVAIDAKFRDGLDVPAMLDEHTLSTFLSLIPALKVNIVRFGKSSLEIEYEHDQIWLYRMGFAMWDINPPLVASPMSPPK